MKNLKPALSALRLLCLTALGLAASCTRSEERDMASTHPDFSTIVFFGDSLTEGFDLRPAEAYPALIDRRLQAAGLPYRAVNAGVSGDTAADGLARAAAALASKPAVLLLAFGTNDIGRGVSPAEFAGSLRRILAMARAANPRLRLAVAGVDLPQLRAFEDYAAFQRIFGQFAAEHGALLIPNLLEGVAGVPELNLPDGLHPNAAGHRIMAERIWDQLQPLLKGARNKD